MNKANHGPRGPRGMNTGAKIDSKVLKRVMKMLFAAFPVLVPVTIACIVFSSITAAAPAIFQQKVIADIQEFYKSGNWDAAAKVIIPKVLILVGFYNQVLSSSANHVEC